MNEHKLLAYIAKELVRIRSENADFLAAGRVTDFAEYKHVCGIIRGLSHAENILNDLVQRMEKDDE